MGKTIIHTFRAPAAIGPYSQAVAAGGFLFVSGQLPINPDDGRMAPDICAQTRQVMDNLMAIISQAGAGADDIVRTTIYLTDMNDFAEVNQIYSSYFKTDFPARATVGINALAREARVEIDAVVALPCP